MDYRSTYQGEIFVKSQCLSHEQALVDQLRSLLACSGYQSVDRQRYKWRSKSQRVFLAIVDDVESLNTHQQLDFLSTFGDQDIIITDNWFRVPTFARVISLPDSWFGIYAYQPNISGIQPSRPYALAVNRIDFGRTQILLELQRRGYLSSGHVNFNCASHESQTDQQKQLLWSNNCQQVDQSYPDIYQSGIDTLTSQMPFCNHAFEIDDVYQHSMLTMVIETYSSDTAVALSEKIFRALVTPRPWTVFGGVGTVQRLQRLGFDVLEDVVDHSYNDATTDRLIEFINASEYHWRNLVWSNIETRCQQAADHNQTLLARFRQQWPLDFAQWLEQNIQYINSPTISNQLTPHTNPQ